MSRAKRNNGKAGIATNAKAAVAANATLDDNAQQSLALVRSGPLGRPVHARYRGLQLTAGDLVVVEDGPGEDGPQNFLATVVRARISEAVTTRVARIIRKANAADEQANARRAAESKQALAAARAKAREAGLSIKIFRVDLGTHSSRARVYFASEQRVDFRSLVNTLSKELQRRIEMRQVGVREEAKAMGGMGTCGRELCCSSFLQSFAPVSIRMAKTQNIALTPSKISGQCGRLKCCLVYEYEAYQEAAKELPRPGKMVNTPDGVGDVRDVDVLQRRVRVFFPDKPPVTYAASAVGPAPRSPKTRSD